MSTGTAIEWTEATWNPVAGCTPVSPGCLHCYAASMANRLEAMGQAKYVGLTVKRNGVRTFNGKINLDPDALLAPPKWKKPRRVFVNSMSDLFHEGVPFEFVDKVFAVMALTPQHTYQVLTKRPEWMAKYLDRARRSISYLDDAARSFGYTLRFDTGNGHPMGLVRWPLPNVWLGTSVERQQEADERIPHLLKCPAAVRFLSCEPLLGPVQFYRGVDLHWVIVGGESGPRARPMHPDWARSIRDQCQAAGVAFFFKQHGEWIPADQMPQGDERRGAAGVYIDRGGKTYPENGPVPLSTYRVCRVGKHAAGRLLDGREWSEFPSVTRPPAEERTR